MDYDDDNYDDDLFILEVLDDMDETDEEMHGKGCLSAVVWFALMSVIVLRLIGRSI